MAKESNKKKKSGRTITLEILIFFPGCKKTIDISNQKSLKVFRQRRSPGPPWTPEKKLRKVTSPGPRPLLEETYQETKNSRKKE